MKNSALKLISLMMTLAFMLCACVTAYADEPADDTEAAKKLAALLVEQTGKSTNDNLTSKYFNDKNRQSAGATLDSTGVNFGIPISETLPDDLKDSSWKMTRTETGFSVLYYNGDISGLTLDGENKGTVDGVVMVNIDNGEITSVVSGRSDITKKNLKDKNNVEQEMLYMNSFEKYPDPVEPGPTEPDPTEPDPTEPEPTEPDPTEPDPTEPDEDYTEPEYEEEYVEYVAPVAEAEDVNAELVSEIPLGAPQTGDAARISLAAAMIAAAAVLTLARKRATK